MKSTTICIANHKGGVGKTTTAVTLATGFAALGCETILIDTDPQGHVAQFLGYEPRPDLLALLTSGGSPSYFDGQRLTIYASDSSTSIIETAMRTAENTLSNSPITINSLKQQIKSIARGFECDTVFIIDTAPTLSSVQLAALIASDWLLIPASPEYASETGIAALIQAIDKLQQSNPNLTLLGILPTLVDMRYSEHKEIINELESRFPGLVLPQVRKLTAIAEAPGRGQTIWDYKPEAAKDYAAVLMEVVKRIGI